MARWFLEGFDRGHLDRGARAIFVGGVMSGTSLAAPSRIREVASYLANYALFAQVVLKAGSLALPFMTVADGVVGIVRKVLKTVSRVPIVDAGIALVPGFSGMARVSTNAELINLMSSTDSRLLDHYYAVASRYTPPDDWRFWKMFRERTRAVVTDRLFPGDHDLVVDTKSCVTLAGGIEISDSKRLLVYEGSDVHHTNYFRQSGVVEMIYRFSRGDDT